MDVTDQIFADIYTFAKEQVKSLIQKDITVKLWVLKLKDANMVVLGDGENR